MKQAWRHQDEARGRAKLMSWFAVYFGVGLGKTKTTIDFIRDFATSLGRVPRTLVFCPPRVVPGWKREFLEHSKIAPENVVLLLGSGKKRLELFQTYQHRPGVIFVMNYESLLMDDLFVELMKWKAETVVWDESHRLKSPTSKRSKKADQLCNPFDMMTRRPLPRPIVYLLSGSAILNSPMDIFMQFKIMDGGRAFGTNFFAFRARYFRDRNAAMPKHKYFPKWELMTKEKDGFDAVNEINRIINENGMIVTEGIDLPEEINIPVKVPMGKEQTRVYKELKQNLITFLNSRPCTAQIAITKSLRLRQITTGFLSTESEDVDSGQVLTSFEDCPRIETFKELLESLLLQDQEVLVWAVFKRNYADIVKACEEVRASLKLDFEVVEVHGGIPEKKQDENLLRFEKDPNVRVFVGHPKSGGIGVNNLIGAGATIIYSEDFSRENEIQSKGRNRRGGSIEAGHKSIVYYKLMCEGTVDETIDEALKTKNGISADTLKASLLRGV